MDAVNDPAVREVVLMKSAQIGYTEMLGNVVGYFIDQDPAPILLVQPTLEMGEAWSKDRLAPMLRDTPALRDKVADPKARATGNTLLHKTFAGGHLTIAGANSPSGLASRPIRIVLCDEVDRYPASAGAEGDPVSLARKRSTTFWNRKLIMGSTPTVKGKSRIEDAYNGSDQRRYYVPCPHCDHWQVLRWAQVSWPEGQPQDAHYACEECGSVITDADKASMLRAGEWRPTAPFNGVAGFHISELYSPWVTFGQMAQAFVEAKRLPETLKTWINTALGESWEEQGESMDETGLLDRREMFPAQVPAGAVLLTCGVDVQDDRLELEVIGHGAGQETWSIDYQVFRGDPSQDPSKSPLWKQLDDYLLQEWDHESGMKLRIAATGIDTGGHCTAQVYQFCRKRLARRVFALKGIGGEGKPLVSKPTRNNAAGVKLFMVGTDTMKDLIHGRLKVAEPGPGYCHFPAERDEDWFAGLTSEKMITVLIHGRRVRKWVKKGSQVRNEPLDCRQYGLAALEILNANLDKVAMTFAKRVAKAAEPKEEAEPESPLVPIQQVKPKPSPRPRRPGGFVTGWKR